MKLSDRGIKAAIRSAHQRIMDIVQQREELERELLFEDQRLASIQAFREDLERAMRDGNKEAAAYIERAIRDVLAQPTNGPIDSPLEIVERKGLGRKPRKRRAAVR